MTTQERYEIMFGDKKLETQTIVGNTAKSLEPERREPETRVKKKVAHTPAAVPYEAWKNIRLYLAIVAIALMCVCHVALSSANYAQRKDNALLKTQISAVEAKNTELKTNIVEGTNLAKIKRIATKRYGMVSPSKSHIISYGSEKKDYVRQYSVIPD